MVVAPGGAWGRPGRGASREGVSMNRYVVFALSRVTAADAVVEQRATFDALRSR